MKKHLILIVLAFTLAVINTREVKAQAQDEAPGHVDETLPDSVKSSSTVPLWLLRSIHARALLWRPDVR